MLARLRPFMAGAAAETAVAMAAAATESDGHVHYNHTDACSGRRWTAKESYEYMYARPWNKVVGFYAELVRAGAGAAGLAKLFGGGESENTLDTADNCASCSEKESVTISSKDQGGRWERVTFKIVLSYHGGSFDGWQKQPGLNTVQGLVEKHLGKFIDERKAKQLEAKSLPIEGCAVVAGRTDKGVTALQQVCSFYTWRQDVKSRDIKDVINEAAPGKLTALHVSEVSRAFHPNFAAKWRRYLYIFPLDEEAKTNMNGDNSKTSSGSNDCELKGRPVLEQEEQAFTSSEGSDHDAMCNIQTKPKSFNVSKVDQLIRRLEGKSLSYRMFARDTQASRSIGPATECFMFHSRAAETELSSADEGCQKVMRVMCVELVANRFLRKMVRVLVATAIREAAAGADEDALLNLMDAACRRATAPPAPPEGLCLVNVGYEEFKRDDCLILE